MQMFYKEGNVFLFLDKKTPQGTDLLHLCRLKEFEGDEAGQYAYIIDWGRKINKIQFHYPTLYKQ